MAKIYAEVDVRLDIDFEPTGPGKLPPARYPQAVEIARNAEQLWLRKQWDGVSTSTELNCWEVLSPREKNSYQETLEYALSAHYVARTTIRTFYPQQSPATVYIYVYVGKEQTFAGCMDVLDDNARARFQAWCTEKLERTKVNALPQRLLLRAHGSEPRALGLAARSQSRQRQVRQSPTGIDGLTHDVIRERHAFHQRESDTRRSTLPLTPAQLAWAREDWSAQLRAKVQASKERERNAITCEPNYVDD